MDSLLGGPVLGEDRLPTLLGLLKQARCGSLLVLLSLILVVILDCTSGASSSGAPSVLRMPRRAPVPPVAISIIICSGTTI